MKLPVYNTTVASRLIARGAYILIVEVPFEDKQWGGLWIPDTAQKAPQIGFVISVGPEVTAKLDEGSFVVFSMYAGIELKLGRDKFIFVPDVDVIGQYFDN